MYTYSDFCQDTDYLVFKGLRKREIGVSYLGNPIIALESGSPDVIVTGGIHARENISVYAAMMCAYRVLRSKLGNVAVVPLLNPDGLLLVEKGAFFAGAKELSRLCNGDFGIWKANARAVDLNVNFDAGFGTGACNVFSPAAANYVGVAPFSESETRAIADYTVEVKPAVTLSFHAQGREIYWYFGQTGETKTRDRQIAEKLAETTGYALIDSDLGSAGGYKDWCIKKLGIPSFTVELGLGTHPLPEDMYSAEWRRISGLADTLSVIGENLRKNL